MDVKQIQYFSLVGSTGSFNAAAKQLYISVPGLVKAMDRLDRTIRRELRNADMRGSSYSGTCHCGDAWKKGEKWRTNEAVNQPTNIKANQNWRCRPPVQSTPHWPSCHRPWATAHPSCADSSG